MNMDQMINFMSRHGSSVSLTWCEAADWECAWISSGVRLLGYSDNPLWAIRKCLHKSGLTWECEVCYWTGTDGGVGCTSEGNPCCPACSAPAPMLRKINL